MIQSCNKKTQTDLKTVKKFSWDDTVFEMHLFHRGGQPQDRVNQCAGGLCSHICNLTQRYFRCVCPEGMHLKEGGRTYAAASIVAFASPNGSLFNLNKLTKFRKENDNGRRLGACVSCKSWTCADKTSVDLQDVCNGTQGCPDGTDEVCIGILPTALKTVPMARTPSQLQMGLNYYVHKAFNLLQMEPHAKIPLELPLWPLSRLLWPLL